MATTAAITAPRSSRESTARPKISAGSASTGSVNNVAVDSRPTAVSDVVTVVPSNPARVSIWYWVAPPVATPPGSARLSAFPASCAVATSNQLWVPIAIR